METRARKPIISIVIPAYNEDRDIEYTIREMKSVLESYGKPYEIIVVDDGSADLTGRMAALSGARVLKFKTNMGKGNALRAGFSKAQGEIIVTIDANGSYKPEEIARLVLPIERGEADVVSGTRFSKVSNVRPHSLNFLNYLGQRLLSLEFELMTGSNVTDILSGFKAFKKRDVERLCLQSRGSEIEGEILSKACSMGLRVKEVPVTYRSRYVRYGDPEFRTIGFGVRLLKTILGMT